MCGCMNRRRILISRRTAAAASHTSDNIPKQCMEQGMPSKICRRCHRQLSLSSTSAGDVCSSTLSQLHRDKGEA